MENIRILILAAGKSTRMKSKYAKVLHRVGGATLIEHVVRAAQAVSRDIFVVVGHSAEMVKALVPNVKFIDQHEQLGTGHAVMAARESFSRFTGDVLVLPGDVPLISASTLEAFIKFHRESGATASVLTAETANPHGYGRIVRRHDNEVQSIVEHRDATPEILKISEINSSIYVFNAPVLFESLTKIKSNNAQGEYYLTDVIQILVNQRLKVGAFKINRTNEILGINTRQELAAVDRVMRRQKCESLMAEGVTIIDPDTTFIDADDERSVTFHEDRLELREGRAGSHSIDYGLLTAVRVDASPEARNPSSSRRSRLSSSRGACSMRHSIAAFRTRGFGDWRYSSRGSNRSVPANVQCALSASTWTSGSRSWINSSTLGESRSIR